MLNLLKNYYKIKHTNDKENLYIPKIDREHKLSVKRDFPISTQNWYNSIYSFNKNTEKLILPKYNLTNKLIKTYFSLIFDQKKGKYKKNTMKKIFSSKAELKHFNDKLIITVFIYNRAKKIQLNKILNLYNGLYLRSKAYRIKNKIEFFNDRKINLLKKKGIKHLNSKFDRNTYKKWHKVLNSKSHILPRIFFKKKDRLNKICQTRYFKNLYLNNLFNDKLQKKFGNLYSKYNKLFKNFNYNIGFLNKTINLKNKTNNNNLLNFINKYDILNNKVNENQKIKFFNSLIKNSFVQELNYLKYYQKLMNHVFKYDNVYLFRLKDIISKIYNKKVEFNIINLKYPYMNMDIFSTIVFSKLEKNWYGRKRKYLKPRAILRKSLKNPVINLSEIYYYKIKNLYVKNYNILNLKNIFINNNNNNDVLNLLLNNIFNVKNRYNSINIKNKYIYRSIKFRNIRGIKWIIKGRITKRFTASRSIKDTELKGSFRNVNSSIKSFSSISLKGHIYSNIQYSNMNWKTRNGGYGFRGWMASK